MRIISGEQISRTIKTIAPERIAVAYLSGNWARYVDIKKLKEIVVAPVRGTDPQEVMKIAREIGWENVYLLDRLHAKIYLGSSSAAFGSFNLSFNGLSGTGNFEAGAFVEDAGSRSQLEELFARYKDAALNQYPSTEKKKKQLAKLQLDTNVWLEARSQTGDIELEEFNEKRSLADYEPITDRDFYCAFWTYKASYDLDKSVFKSNLDIADLVSAPNFDLDRLIHDQLPFQEEDEITPGRWMLVWGEHPDGTFDTRKKCNWLYVHAVQPGGAIEKVDEKYSKIVLQWKNKVKQAPSAPPFDLADPKIKEALGIVINSKEFPVFSLDGEQSWSINPTFGYFKKFIQKIKSEYLKLLEDNSKKDIL